MGQFHSGFVYRRDLLPDCTVQRRRGAYERQRDQTHTPHHSMARPGRDRVALRENCSVIRSEERHHRLGVGILHKAGLRPVPSSSVRFVIRFDRPARLQLLAHFRWIPQLWLPYFTKSSYGLVLYADHR